MTFRIFEAGAELRRILKDRSEALFPQLGDEGDALRLNLRKVSGGRMFDFRLYTLQKINKSCHREMLEQTDDVGI